MNRKYEKANNQGEEDPTIIVHAFYDYNYNHCPQLTSINEKSTVAVHLVGSVASRKFDTCLLADSMSIVGFPKRIEGLLH